MSSTQGTSSAVGSAASIASSTSVHTEDCNNLRDDPIGPDPNRWFFDKERLETTPSRKFGLDADKELNQRQQSANLIQDMGQRLQVNQLCINTAIVYMHRFYMYHSFTHFHRNQVSTASIFLAAKVEEQPRKLEHVIKVAHHCLNRDQPPIDTKSDAYLDQASDLVMTENILLQTLGFDVAIDHPHTHVVKCCQLVRASKDLAQTSYFMATNSLHLTTMCLQYKPTVVACVCIHLTCKWSNWEIPRSKEGKDWFWYVDETVTMDLLKKLTTEFLAIIDKSPSRLKRKILSLNQAGGGGVALSSYPALNYDPNSPGSTSTSYRTHSSPLPPSSLGKRSLPPSKSSSGNPVNPKPGKVNGSVGHHPLKPGHGSQNPANSTALKPPHFPPGSKQPSGPPHVAKDINAQHTKQMGHHHPSSSGHPQQHGSGRPSSSHPHPSGHHSQNHGPNLSSQPPPKPQVPSSSSHPLGHQHTKPQQHPPSKSQYNYNMKAQQAPPVSLPSSKTASIPPLTSVSSMPGKPHQPPPPYSQSQQPKKHYPEPSRREPAANPDFHGKRENSEDPLRRNAHQPTPLSQRPKLPEKDSFGSGTSSGLPPVSAPFNSNSAEPSSRSWDTVVSNVATEAPRIPQGRTSLFSPDPGLPDTPTITSMQPFGKLELLSPIGEDHLTIGAKGDVSDSISAAGSGSLFPNLFEFGSGNRSSSNSNDDTPFSRTDSKEVVGTLGGPESLTEAANLISSNMQRLSSAPFSMSGSATIGLPNSGIRDPAAYSNLPTLSESFNSQDGEPPAKKSKKSKKEKHRHRDRERDRHDDKKDKKDKEEKKHKDKSKEKSKDEKKHKSDKHKKDKHKDKDREKHLNSKQYNEGEDPMAWAQDVDASTNKLKISLGSRVGDIPSPEKSKSKHSSKKHGSSVKSSSSTGSSGDMGLVSTTNSSASAQGSIKLKIKPPRPPSHK